MRIAIPYRGGELEATLDGDTWTARLGELEVSSRYLDYALARLLDTDGREVHKLAASIVEQATSTTATYTVVVVDDGAEGEHLYQDRSREVVEREVLVVDGKNVVVEQVSQPDGEQPGRIRARPLPVRSLSSEHAKWRLTRLRGASRFRHIRGTLSVPGGSLPAPLSVDRLAQAGLDPDSLAVGRQLSTGSEVVGVDHESRDDREIRAARNQAIFRAVNEKILSMNEGFGALEGMVSIACECDQVDCVQLIELPFDAYTNVRRNPRTFVVLAKHVAPDVERVVSTHDGYAVVEAIGRGAQVAEATFRPGRHSLSPDTPDR